MFLHWADLALLLLLPRAVNGEDNAQSKKIGKWEGSSCHDPWTRKCEEASTKGGNCTLHCFHMFGCDFKRYKPVDYGLLKITAISFLRVDKEGRITERYINKHTTAWAEKFARPIGFYVHDMEFKGNLKEAQEKIAQITDIILYIGTDYADSYDKIEYRYDPSNLHLKNGKYSGDLYKGSVFPVCMTSMGFVRGPGNPTQAKAEEILFKSRMSRNYPESWISSPGIYRLNKESGRLTELYYDPNLNDSHFLN